MDFTGWTSSEEGEDHKVGWKGHNFLGCTRYNSYRLPFIEPNDQWQLLRSLIGPLQQQNKILNKKRPIWRRRKCSFIKTMHGFIRAPMAKFNEFRYELFPHPAYSPAPCDYFLFPNLKKWFGGKRFITRE